MARFFLLRKISFFLFFFFFLPSSFHYCLQVFLTNGVSIAATQKMCEKAFGSFDLNNDGLIDLKEFIAAFKPYWAYQFNEVYILLKDAPHLLKNVINVPLQNALGGCPFSAEHSIPLDFDSSVIDWAKLVQGENVSSLDRALKRVKKRMDRFKL
jgi:hypothetical protein